ncbi:ABC transporter permease subunit [Brenneria tiliae]|uniref:ABC transporter permease subunit n=1 Tax=Brenneria tiliae TaxID=2914984 RepID=A0ABT0MP98_9GAMM|nr:ABC transporter permease subunit [Brenneria tiliae]MCL2891666.1 ABC transporter permease subunit [Brenneria tiliae]
MRKDSLRASWLLLPAFLLLAVGFLAPLGQVLWISLEDKGGFNPAAYAQVLGSAVFWTILWRTVRTALLVTLCCMLLGYPFAYFVATRARRMGRWIMALVMIPYLTSVLIRSYAWVAILGNNGPVNYVLRAVGLIQQPLPLVFSTFGSYIGLVHVLLPLLILPLYAAMTQIDRALRDAAANLGATPLECFFTVYFPLSLPGLMTGSALVFLSTLGAYVTPALLGAPNDFLLAQSIQVRVAVLGEFRVTSAQAIILLAIVIAVVIFLRHLFIPAAIPAAGSGDRLSEKRPRRLFSVLSRPVTALLRLRVFRLLESVATPFLTLYGSGLLLLLLLPMLVVVLLSFSGAAYLTFPPPSYSWRWWLALAEDRNWLDALWFSVKISVLASVTALIVGVPYAYAIVRRNPPGRRLLWLIAIAPMVLPHIIIGLGLLFISVSMHINGGVWGFWVGYATIGFPYVVTILASGFMRFDVSLERAAANLGAHPVWAFKTVMLPLMSMSFFSAFLFAFLAGFDELVIGLFLSSPANTPIAMRMWEDIQLEINPKTAVIGSLQLLVLLAGIVVTTGWRWLRPAGRHAGSREASY